MADKRELSKIIKSVVLIDSFQDLENLEDFDKDRLDKLLERVSDDNEAQADIACIMKMAEKEFLYFRDNADTFTDFYGISNFDFDSIKDKLFAIRRFAKIEVSIETDNTNEKTYIIVKPFKFQRSYSLLLYIQELMENKRSPDDIFLIYHRLERPGRPSIRLRDQYDSFKSGMRILNRLYPDDHIEIHEVKWYDEDPGTNADLSWNEDTEMKDYGVEERRETYLGIDLAGIFSRIEQDKAYETSLFSNTGWVDCSDGLLHKENYMVDINTGQRWKWSWKQNKDWEDMVIDSPELLD